MKRNITLLGLVVMGFANAQDGRVGINTSTPNASLDISRNTIIPASNPQGLLLPNFTKDQRDVFDQEKLVNGLMIFNTTKNCIDWWDGNQWSCIDGTQPDYPTNSTTIDSSVKADVWDRTHYIASFNYRGTNIDGIIDNATNKIILKIAYNSATVGKNYSAIKIKRQVKNRNGNLQTLTLDIPAGTFGASKGFLTATIIVDDGSATASYQVPRLNANVEEILTNFNFNINANTANVRLVVSGGVPDKKIGNVDYNFIYVPVSAYPSFVETLPDAGKPYEAKWLNNNLGANYAKIGNNQHNKQAISNTDYNAYGYLYEFGRDSDGHEVINWSASGGSFKDTSSQNYDYLATNNPKNNAGDPCPTGYHTPTKNEWDVFFEGVASRDKNKGLNNLLNDKTITLATVGARAGNGSNTVATTNKSAYYWSGSTDVGNNVNSYYFYFQDGFPDAIGVHSLHRTYGFPVRCIATNQ